MAGAALVTEISPGVERYLPAHLYLSAAYADLVETTVSLLGEPEQVEMMSSAASIWLDKVYIPRCQAAWQSILHGLYRDHGIVKRQLY